MFNFSFDKRALYFLIAIMVIGTLARYASNTEALLGLLLTIPGVLIAITFHEFAHAYAADKLGDDTPRKQRRLSLNPKDHIDPLGFAILLFANIGWGRPVQINPRNFNRDITMEKAEAIVSIAGPLMNFALALVLTIIYCLIYKFAPLIMLNQVGRIILEMISSAMMVNIGLGVFNLIPLPPLDGSKIFTPFLPTKVNMWLRDNERIFYYIFLFIWIFGLANIIITPIIRVIATSFLKLGLLIVGL